MTPAPTPNNMNGAMQVLMLMRMADGCRVVGWMRMIVFSTRHAVRMCLHMMMCAVWPKPTSDQFRP